MEEDKNYINLIHGDLVKASQVQSGMPVSVGVMSIKTANQTILEASQKPTPRSLWDCFWYEGELSCLFADSNVGKSILAVQIADRIARTDNVLYLDFELSEKQFQLRYTNEYGKLYSFPERLYRVSLDCNSLLDANFEEAIIGSIEQMALQTDCRIFIVDNLTYLCCAMEKGDAAGRLMIQLNNLKKRYELSILVLAHTPKRSLDCPITSNDLAGSKRLYNFFDSVFAIGKSAKDSGLRYVKQLKVRYGTYSHDAENVIVYEIEKVDAFLQFVHRGYSTEKEHLKQLGDKESTERDNQILELSRMGKSVREIATQVGCGKSTVGRKLQKLRQDDAVPVSQPQDNKDVGQGGTVENAEQMDLFNETKRRRNHENPTCRYLYRRLRPLQRLQPSKRFFPDKRTVPRCPTVPTLNDWDVGQDGTSENFNRERR